MVRDRIQIDRRSFIKGAAPFALGLHAIVRAQVPIERGRFNEDDVPLAREQLLRMVNEERSQAGLGTLELDDLACKVATDHAVDMSRHDRRTDAYADGRNRRRARKRFVSRQHPVARTDGRAERLA